MDDQGTVHSKHTLVRVRPTKMRGSAGTCSRAGGMSAKVERKSSACMDERGLIASCQIGSRQSCLRKAARLSPRDEADSEVIDLDMAESMSLERCNSAKQAQMAD
jgi:hypothetical protein